MDRTKDDLRDGMAKWKNEILTSNDKIAGKLDKILTEQQSISANYKRIDRQVEKEEDYIEEADQKLELGFEQA